MKILKIVIGIVLVVLVLGWGLFIKPNSEIQKFAEKELTQKGYSNISLQIKNADTMKGNFSADILFSADTENKEKVTGQAKVKKTGFIITKKILEITEIAPSEKKSNEIQ